MGAFEYRQAQEIRDCFQRDGIRYLFLGKSGAILLGFPDTTQDADLFVEKTPGNCAALVPSLRDLGFGLSDAEAGEVARGETTVQSDLYSLGLILHGHPFSSVMASSISL